MNKLFLLTSIICMASSTVMAQDDMYFTPKKKTAEEKAAEAAQKTRIEAYRKAHTIDETFYAGCNRDVDEYNRRRTTRVTTPTIQQDSLGNDVITFSPGTGTYPDSIQSIPCDSLYQVDSKNYRSNRYDKDYYDDLDDYYYSRRLSRFYGYAGPYWGPWRHYYDPWYWDWYGDPFFYDYCGWYDPWYYGYCGWYDPWYYGYNGYWGGHWYGGWGRPGIIHIGGAHGGMARADGPRTAWGTANHSTSRNNYGGRAATTGARTMTRSVSANDRTVNQNTQTRSRIFGTDRSNNVTRSYNESRSTFNSPTRSSNFGGSSSFGGGARMGGGASMGGGARGGGGGRR